MSNDKVKIGDIELWLGDCLELMKDIPDKSVNLVLSDPPFGSTSLKWDKIIPFDKLWKEYERMITNGGGILLFGTEPFSTKLRASKMDWYKYDWYWVKKKSNGFQHSKNRPMMKVENISVFSPYPMGHSSLLGDKRMKYNPQGIISSGQKTVRGHGNILGARPNQIGREYESFTNFPDNVLFYDNIFGRDALHPTQKPVLLLEYLIKTYTDEGESVLDNTMGVGSTLVACKNTGRRGIGIEKEKKYFDIAVERLNK